MPCYKKVSHLVKLLTSLLCLVYPTTNGATCSSLHGERPYVHKLKAIWGSAVGMRQFLQFRSELCLVRIVSNWMPVVALPCILYSISIASHCTLYTVVQRLPCVVYCIAASTPLSNDSLSSLVDQPSREFMRIQNKLQRILKTLSPSSP